MSGDKSNFFYHAYTESSQDGFICWLLNCACPKVKSEHKQVKAYGQRFLGALFSKHGENLPTDLGNLEIFQQVKCAGKRNRSIDMLIRIGKYVLLIEDKIHGEDDNEKLLDYIHNVINGDTKSTLEKVPVENLLPIYLKTGNQSLYNKVRIEHLNADRKGSKSYKVFDRADFMEVLEQFNTAHPILDDFTARLKCWDRTTESFKNWDQAKEWEYTACEGFFRELENHLVVINKDNSMVGFDEIKNTWEKSWPNDNPKGWGWDWVNNTSGGFFGFWWYFKTMESCKENVDIYLQLEIKPKKPESRKLCFKVGTDTSDKSLQYEIKWDCHERILNAGNNLLRKPDVMRIGGTMTVAEWNIEDGQNPWLVFNPNGGPDIQNTVKNLIKAQSILDGV